MKNRNFDLKRKRNPKDIICQLVIFCEDTYAAPDYFQALNKDTNNPSIRIIIEKGCGEPKSLIDKAIERRQAQVSQAKKDENKDIHQVWAVFDKDRHPHFEEPIQKGEAKGVKIAYAIPCFELWLMLHFECYNAPGTHEKIQKKFKKKMPDYGKGDKKTADFTELVKQVETAEKHADWLQTERYKEGINYGNPSTTIQHLTREIRGALKTIGHFPKLVRP